jgi:hypothetical protein
VDLYCREKAIEITGLTDPDLITFDDFIFNEKIIERIC